MQVALTPRQCAQHVDGLRTRVEESLGTLVSATQPVELYEPARYVLAGGGKRLRPVLLLLAAEAFDVEVNRAMPAALAVEVFHNFTLVHDDVMDHASTRRGRPTVHTAWDESTAILSGDLLMGLSYDLLAQSQTDGLADLMSVFNRMVVALCEGQAYDKQFESQPDVELTAYFDMIDRKTAALLQAALELGGVLGGADRNQRQTLRSIGKELGRAFQIQDDLLDLVADDARWGKSIGGDLVEGKKTYLLLHALERAEGDMRAWFQRVVAEGGLPQARVDEARARMERLGVLDAARRAVDAHSRAAQEQIALLPSGAAVDTLLWLVERLRARLH
jgi:geranylgeranyl diphosphate synthase type II